MTTQDQNDTHTVAAGSASDTTAHAMRHFYGPGFDKIMPISSAIAAAAFEASVTTGSPHDALWGLAGISAAISGDALPDTVGSHISEKTLADIRSIIDKFGEEGEDLIIKALNVEVSGYLLSDVLFSDIGPSNYIKHLRSI